MAGELLSEGAIHGSQAGDLSAGGKVETDTDSVGFWRLPQEAQPASPPWNASGLTHPPLLTVTRDSTAHEPL